MSFDYFMFVLAPMYKLRVCETFYKSRFRISFKLNIHARAVLRSGTRLWRRHLDVEMVYTCLCMPMVGVVFVCILLV